MSPAAAVRTIPFSRSPAWLLAGALTLLLAGLHLHFIRQAGGFWRDEVNLLNVADRASWAGLTHDSFPLLLPLLVKVWSGLGGGAESSLRGLGALVGLGLLGALWISAWTARRSPPLISLGLLGLNSTVICYGDELRAYGLGSLTIVLVLAAGGRFLQKPGWSRAGWFALAAVFSVQALFHNAVLVAAVGLAVAILCARQRQWRGSLQILAAGGVAALSLLPYLPNFLAGRGAVAVLRSGFDGTKFCRELVVAAGFPTAG
ncbi:MAG TPA: hypothetical protein VF607_06485, partial [Verrucomicrobiae bacterium]